MLDQLESSTEDKNISFEQKTPQQVKEKTQFIQPSTKPTAVTATPKTLEKQVKDRAAKTETKSALMEALEKAKALRNQEIPRTSVKPPVPSPDLGQVLQSVIKTSNIEEKTDIKDLYKKNIHKWR